MVLNLDSTPAGRLGSRLAWQFASWSSIAGDPTLPNLDRAPSPGKWSAREHLAHIARMHEVYERRIGAILSGDGPKLPAYRAENDPEWPKWQGLPAADILERARGLRSRLIDQVRPLTDLDLAKIGVHGKLGPFPLSLWLEFFLVHEGHHLYEILRLVREP